MPLSRQAGLYAVRKERLHKAIIVSCAWIFAWCHTRILHAMRIVIDKRMSGGIFCFSIIKRKFPPRVLIAIYELTRAFASVILNLSKGIVTYHIRKNATLKRHKQRKLLIFNGIFDDSLRIKRPMTTMCRTSGTTGIRNNLRIVHKRRQREYHPLPFLRVKSLFYWSVLQNAQLLRGCGDSNRMWAS